MLNQEENELLCRVGPGTPMGNLLREYWMPFLLSSELPDADCKPLRVKLLGEDLVAFRDSHGRVGLIEEHCAHRGASLYFARNEHGGLRCVYHGWMYDVSGRCVDMPNEPAYSNFKEKVRLTAYPCQERNGLVWTYMGPHAELPPLPDLEWNVIPREHVIMWKNLQDCNWVQGVEGVMDSSHLSFLHTRLSQSGNAGFPGAEVGLGLFQQDPAMRLEAVDTDYGVMYGAGRGEDVYGVGEDRRKEEDTIYWRITHFLMPFYTMFAPIAPDECPLQWWVPLDDNTVMKWNVRWNPTRPLTDDERKPRANEPGGYITPTSDPYTHWRLAANAGNDHFLDYEAQQTKRYSGLPTINLQDKAMQESMGATADRTREHLGVADTVIIRTRQRLIGAANALRDHGVAPPGVGDPSAYRVRSGTMVLPNDEDWVGAARDSLEAFVERPVMSGGAPARANR